MIMLEYEVQSFGNIPLGVLRRCRLATYFSRDPYHRYLGGRLDTLLHYTRRYM